MTNDECVVLLMYAARSLRDFAHQAGLGGFAWPPMFLRRLAAQIDQEAAEQAKCADPAYAVKRVCKACEAALAKPPAEGART